MAKSSNNKSKAKSKSKQPTPEETAAKHRTYVENRLPKLRHSPTPLFVSLIAALDAAAIENPSTAPIDKKAPRLSTPLEKLQYDACKMMDDLREKSSVWAFSLHWAYTVANPAIDDIQNDKYSPLYKQHACQLPNASNGEFDYKDVDGKKLVRHGDKIVGNDRFAKAGTAEFGNAWDADGNIVKHDATGGPIRDGWFGSICARIDSQQAVAMKKHRRGRHFAAFLIAHTRDEFVPTYGVDVLTKPRHLHGAMKLPDEVTRLRLMQAMGVTFDDYVAVFNWIAKNADTKLERADAFVATLQGVMKNYEIPEDFMAKLQYLVHESYGAEKDDKIPYLTSEVIAWLPDDPHTTYSRYAGVYDNQAAATGLNDAIIRNLHNDYNTHFHVAELVGMKADNKPFTYAMLRDFRSLMTHARGKNSPSSRALELIPQAIMRLIRTGEITVGDWPTLLHAAFDEADADALLSNKKFVERMGLLIEAEIKATLHDSNYDRDLQTTLITAKTGGIGKSYLANLLATHYDHGRKPYAAATVDKKKTPDLWQQYDNQLSAILDELGPGTISLQTWKDTFDQHKLPPLPSRNTNKTPVFVHHVFITDVFNGGVAEYVRKVLRYAEGVSEWGYLKKGKNRQTDKVEWRLIQNSDDAAHHYLSQLSQILRRLPVWIEMSPTPDGKATNIKISILAYKPSGRAMTHYDYCHTADSCFRINTILTDKTPKDVAKRIGKKVADAITALQAQADAIFDQDITAWLPDHDGFTADNCHFGVRELDGHLSLVDLDSAPDLAGFDPNEADDIFG